MTNQEAIKILGQYDVSNIHFYTTDGEEIPFTDWSDALELAISALRTQDLQPTCNQPATDTISRQAAIDAVERNACNTQRAIEAIEALPSAQPEPCEDAISRQAAIEETKKCHHHCVIPDDYHISAVDIEYRLFKLPSVTPKAESCEDADKLKRCRFEYINACKTVTYPTPDTSKNDIYDAHAVIKALHPIFGDEDFKKTERKDALQKSYAEGKTDD